MEIMVPIATLQQGLLEKVCRDKYNCLIQVCYIYMHFSILMVHTVLCYIISV